MDEKENKEVTANSEEQVKKEEVDTSQVKVDTPKEDVQSDSEANVVSETVIEADVNNAVSEKTDTENNSSLIEEVSITADSEAFNTLNENEISENSVFNKKNETETTTSTMKEGQEFDNQKKGFPFFMVFVLIAVIVFTFFIDDIVTYFNENYINKKVAEEETEEQKEKEKEPEVKSVNLEELKASLEKSEDISNYPTEVSVEVSENTLTMTTNPVPPAATPYVQMPPLSVNFVLENDVLTAACDANNSGFGLDMSVIIIKEIAKIQEVDNSKIDDFLEDNKFTLTIEKGFELTHSEDGNNVYKIATNIKLNV